MQQCRQGEASEPADDQPLIHVDRHSVCGTFGIRYLACECIQARSLQLPQIVGRMTPSYSRMFPGSGAQLFVAANLRVVRRWTQESLPKRNGVYS